MIAYDLKCSQNHSFEGWFDSAESFEDQNARDLIACPICEDTVVSRVLSPVRSLKSSGFDDHQTAMAAQGLTELMKVVGNYVSDNFEDVGADFAKEALKIHYGASPKRSIRGVSTGNEEEMLREEGVEFIKLPLPKSLD